MLLTFFFLICTLSAATITWYVFLNDRPTLKAHLRQKNKLFVCGICQVFWLSLLLTAMINPLEGFSVPLRFVSLSTIEALMLFVFSWSVIMVSAWILRYGTLLLIERLKYQIKRNQQL